MKISDITPGLYSNTDYSKSNHCLVLDGGKLYAKPIEPDGVVTVAPTKRYAYNGSSGLLVVASRNTWRRDSPDLSETTRLKDLVEATDELLRLATTVSASAASAKASEIAGIPLIVRTDINPTAVTRSDDLLDNTAMAEAVSVMAGLRDLDLSTEILQPASKTPGVRLNLTVEQARTVLSALEAAEK